VTGAARAALPFLVLAALAGCAADGGSYVAGLGAPDDARAVAADLVEFVAGQLPATTTTLALDPTPGDQADNVFTPEFADALRRRGFALADANEGAAQVHHVRYLVTPLDNGDLIRLSINGDTEATRFFARNSAGALQPGGPFLVRQLAAVGR
jgi:hypothetical protein